MRNTVPQALVLRLVLQLGGGQATPCGKFSGSMQIPKNCPDTG
jgi:hypothetical protein